MVFIALRRLGQTRFRGRRYGRAATLAVAFALALAGCGREQPGPPQQQAAGAPASPRVTVDGIDIGAQRPAFELPDSDGMLRSVGEWDGRVIVLNFWATWCPPCTREIPAFVDLQETYGGQGLQFVGIAIDDLDKVQDYMDTMGINYPVLVGSLDAIEVSKRYGNRFGALPYTVIVDRQGRVAFIQRGEVSREAAEQSIKELL